ncbi:MAG: sulfotransferase [Chloroflexota bacterium]
MPSDESRRPERRGGSLRYPDFFIVGAPRCGTTFMFEYLSRHPDIYTSPRKEPQYFATDLDSGSYLDSLSFMRDRDEYLDLFSGARPGQLTGEASTWYLYSKDAARNIKAANPHAHIIIMLRDPVEMLYSLHGRRLYGGSEDLTRFEDALAAEAERKLGRLIPPRARNVKALFYREVGRYSDQVKRYLDIFGKQRVHIVIFEDFRADPAAAYRGVLEFLDVDATFEPQFRVVNEGVARRSRRIQRLLLSPLVIRTARWALPQRARPLVGRAWDAINTRGTRRPPLDGAVADKLRRDLYPDMVRLGELIGRDVAAIWK